jgi:hypothetical protein
MKEIWLTRITQIGDSWSRRICGDLRTVWPYHRENLLKYKFHSNWDQHNPHQSNEFQTKSKSVVRLNQNLILIPQFCSPFNLHNGIGEESPVIRLPTLRSFPKGQFWRWTCGRDGMIKQVGRGGEHVCEMGRERNEWDSFSSLNKHVKSKI